MDIMQLLEEYRTLTLTANHHNGRPHQMFVHLLETRMKDQSHQIKKRPKHPTYDNVMATWFTYGWFPANERPGELAKFAEYNGLPANHKAKFTVSSVRVRP